MAALMTMMCCGGILLLSTDVLLWCGFENYQPESSYTRCLSSLHKLHHPLVFFKFNSFLSSYSCIDLFSIFFGKISAPHAFQHLTIFRVIFKAIVVVQNNHDIYWVLPVTTWVLRKQQVTIQTFNHSKLAEVSCKNNWDPPKAFVLSQISFSLLSSFFSWGSFMNEISPMMRIRTLSHLCFWSSDNDPL